MSTPDDVQDAELVPAPMLPLLDWIAQQSQHKERTVRRYLAEGRIPSARKDHGGRWWLPVDAQITPALDDGPAPGALRLATPHPRTELARVQDATDTRPWLRLAELAELVGLSVHNLRRMAADGQLATTTGPHGSTIVWRSEVIRLLGPIR